MRFLTILRCDFCRITYTVSNRVLILISEMLIRLVRMKFHAESSATFLAIFDEMKQHIRHYDGCSHLELLEELGDPHAFTTYSIWDTAEHLDTYRNSALFQSTWKRVKPLMREPAVAVSYAQRHVEDNKKDTKNS
jgi:heme oxygenase (mycobilin-producing)